MARTKSKKRANGEGTFYQLDDKTWVHQITLGRKPNGSPDRKSFSGPTRRACIQRRDEYIEQKKQMESQEQQEREQQHTSKLTAQAQGHSLESESLFSVAFPEWLKLYKSPPTKKATTYSGYLSTYEDHFVDYFGGKMLCEISQEYMQSYYILKQKNGGRRDGKSGGLSPKTIRNHHMLLKDFFDYAKKKYKLEGNPTEDTERPVVHTPAPRVLTPEEMNIFMGEIIRETQRVAILTDLFTGFRVGELLATEVSDLDVRKQGILICRNLARVRTESISLDDPNIKILNYNPDKKTHLIVQYTPKTKTSYRFLPLSDQLFELIAKHLFFLEQSGWPNPFNLLFPSTKGTYIDPKSFEIRLKAVSKRCEMKKVNPHALRHTFATRLIEEDVPITTVKELLGHSSIATTQRYVTTLVEEKRDAVESIAGYLDNTSLKSVAKLNGTKNRMKFEEVRLPSWLQNQPSAAERRLE